ncbi:hypothetical protein [uncultured Rubinisphaera sp.]|uniref:tetratricopeptide repeat protein n=1 Tax=uncultured Rubinisphaera sp. TaxID=1678686 RepID=UPI0030DC10EF
MTIFIRILLLVLLAELSICGYRFYNVNTKIQPLLPEVDFQDPIYIKELNVLRDKVEHQEEQALIQLGDALLAHGYYSHAEFHYRQYLDRFPEHKPCQFKLAFCLDRTGRIEQSTQIYQHLTSMQTGKSEEEVQLLNLANYAIGRNSLRLNEISSAEKIFRNNQEFVPSRVQLVKILIRSNRAEEALPHLEEMLKEIPFSLVLNFWHARALEQMGEELAALEAYRSVERSAYLLPTDFRSSIVKPIRTSFGIASQIEKAEQLFDQGQLNQASVTLQKLFPQPPSPIIPEYPQALQIQGELSLREQNAFLLAELSIKLQAINIQNANVVKFKAAAAYFQLNQTEAERLWKILSLYEFSEQVYRNLWNLYQSTGREQLAQQMKSQALVVAGRQVFRQNQPEQADLLFLESIQDDEQNELAWLYHAEMLFYLNDLENAGEAYQRVLNLNQWNGRAKRALKLIDMKNQSAASNL